VSRAVVKRTTLPVVGCGAGPDCHAFVFVTHDAVGLTPHKPRFAPSLGDWASPMRESFGEYVRQVSSGTYPAAEHSYGMDPAERERFLQKFES
jgi:3-methyl-2-oxobutanoate hydroxymethyltransferase